MVYIRLKNILDEDFQDYKKPSMMLATCQCDWKCLREQELDLSLCQNSELSKQKNINISIDNIVDRYINNSITKAIVIGGLEPFLQFDDILEFIKYFRQKSKDDIVIYTGYYPNEIEDKLIRLKQYKNIIIKFGRYIHEDTKIFDKVLGVWLISSNQFACKIS
jgi:pyruvate-formate lyase-activating enzyme